MVRVKSSFNVSVFLSVFLFLWLSPVSMGLDPAKRISQYRVQVWNMAGGLPGNSIFAICQTGDGYLWLGTQDGLVRFDGLNFRLFDSRNMPLLKDNMIRALYPDRQGSLWIGTSTGGLNRYRQGKFSLYPVNRHKSLYKISAIDEDRWGNLWIGSISEGLIRFNLTTGTFTTYTTGEGLPHNQVRFIHKDGKGDLWVTTAAGIVKLLQPGKFRVYAPQDRLPYFKTVSLYEEESGTLWIGTGGNGLFRLSDRKFTPYRAEAGLPHLTITYLFRDRLKNLWIGTDGGGLSRLRNGVLETLIGGDGPADSFIYSIYEDREGSLWVGTLDRGLYQLRNSKFTTYTGREGLVDDYVNCIHNDRAGDLLIGTTVGVNRLRLNDGRVSTVLTARRGLLSGHVLGLFADPSGSLWIGTLKGLHRFKGGQLSSFTTRDGLADDWITCIQGDSRGDIWIGTGSGLNRFTGKIFVPVEGFAGNRINFIFEDSGGVLWVGSDAGLHRIGEDGITTRHPGADNGGHHIQCMYQDNWGVFWLGSKGGLIRLTGTSTFSFTVQRGLFDNDVSSILEDEKGYLWLGGRNGVSRVKMSELDALSRGEIDRLIPDTYNEKDGMKSRWCTGSGCKTRDGRFWFPTSVGVTTIDPQNIPRSRVPLLPFIEKVVVDGEPIKIEDLSGGALTLAPGKKRLEFYYTAVSFINPARIKFRLMLAGYDRDWLDMGTARSTTYTGLSPGHYTFKVAAGNPYGLWSEKETSFSFYLRPHWYKTWWALSLYLLGALLGVFSFVKWRSARLSREKRHLERTVKERTEEIRQKSRQLQEQSEKLEELDRIKSRFFANISHEFRTPLTLIMGPLEKILSENPDKTLESRANMMLRNSRRLLTLVDQLLELAKFDSGKMKLEASQQDIAAFVKNIVMCFESLARQNRVDLTFRVEAEEIALYFDPEKLERIIFNLLSNAFNYTPAGGKITVSIRTAAGTAYPCGCVEIVVCNTGAGIPADQLPHIFDRFYRGESTHEYKRKGTGIGLALSRELVALHHGQIEAHSTCRRDQTGETEFTLRLPLGDAHLQPEEIVETVDHRFNRECTPSPPPPIITAAEEEPGKSDRPIILVVDDNADLRAYVRGALEPQFNILEAANGQEGVDKAGEIIPDLVISDVMMPELDGYELCVRLKNDIKTSHIPVILLTAKASEESIAEGWETGADDYIIKPFDANLLVIRVQNLVRLRRQLQEKIQSDMMLQPGEIAVSSLDTEFIKELQASIEENLADPEFNVDQLAKKLYMSQSSLYKKVEALTGQSPQLFIRSYRLKRAVQLLKAGAGNVTEVAFKVGFSNTSYFTRCFREKFHRPPSDF
jgi:ligand-binding sensor domain-containing protein/signal transduction histidine kinase/DNA-binding response OmpR family regulator